MKWFKHYSDNHRGQSIQYLLEEFGHTGPCCYYFLMEMCAEKIEYDASGQLVSKFRFNEAMVRKLFRINRATFQSILKTFQELNLLSYKISDKFLEIEMPILLNLLDRDMKKPRKERDQNAQLRRLDKEEDKDIYKEKEKEAECGSNEPVIFNSLTKEKIQEYLETIYQEYPRKEGKTPGMRVALRQIKNEEDLTNLAQSVENYAKRKKGVEKKYLLMFGTFMNQWRDWLDPNHGL